MALCVNGSESVKMGEMICRGAAPMQRSVTFMLDNSSSTLLWASQRLSPSSPARPGALERLRGSFEEVARPQD